MNRIALIKKWHVLGLIGVLALGIVAATAIAGALGSNQVSAQATNIAAVFNGRVGIGTRPTAMLEVACPAGFTNIIAADNQLGCMQTDEANGGIPLVWEDSADFCFDNFGGRLPSTGEWYITMANFDLNDEIDNWEWNDEFGGSSGTDVHAISGSVEITNQSWTPDTVLTVDFRCLLPSGSTPGEWCPYQPGSC